MTANATTIRRCFTSIYLYPVEVHNKVCLVRMTTQYVCNDREAGCILPADWSTRCRGLASAGGNREAGCVIPANRSVAYSEWAQQVATGKPAVSCRQIGVYNVKAAQLAQPKSHRPYTVRDAFRTTQDTSYLFGHSQDCKSREIA